MNSPILRSLTVTALLLACAGCQQRAANKLLGSWEGRPDTAAKRATREAEKYGDPKPSEMVSKPQSDDYIGNAVTDDQVTDWENYDVTIRMDFVSSEKLKIALDGKQPIEGTWNVISTSPSGCTIEVLTESVESNESSSKVVRRRFELLLDERDGVCVGFQLSEAGADAQLGALYFQRPGSASGPQQN